MTKNSKCLLQDGTFFIGYTSLPLKNEYERLKELQGFFEEKRNKLFDKVTKLKVNTPEDIEAAKVLKKNFYRPRYYYLFGNMDLAVMCLVDGFNFPVRQYNYFGIQQTLGRKQENSNERKGFEISFSKHNLLGPTPRFSSKKNIIDLYTGLERKIKKFPLIGIIRIKLNDLFLFDYGVEFIRAYIKSLKITFSKDENLNQNFTFLLLESYSWSEISIVVFCNRFQLIHELIPKIRSISKNEIKKKLKASKQAADSELLNIISRKPSASKNISDNDPVSLDTYTTMGFDYDIIAPINSQSLGSNYLDAKLSMQRLLQISKDDKISPMIECSLKPGCFHSTINTLQKIQSRFFKKEGEYRSLAGKSDLLIQLPKNETISSQNFIKSIRKMGKEKLEDMFIKFSTTLTFKPNENLPKNHSINTYSLIEEKARALIFNGQKLNELNSILKKSNVPHVEQEAFLNFFAVFNNNVSNPLSFAEFIELRPFLEYMETVIKDSISTVPFQKLDLDGPLKTLNHAYRNRSLDNYDNKDRYDYYTFLTIGAQSLVSSFDILYKSFTTVLGNRGSFIFVEADHEFTTSNYALRLNYFHLFNPEILCSVLIQEVCNQCSFRFGKENPDVFIFHRKFDSDKSGTELVKKCLTANGINFSNQKLKYQQILKALNSEKFEHIFADILGVKIFYGENLENYLFWSWAYFSTDSDHYYFQHKEDKLEINEERFSQFLLRQLIVLRIWNPEKYKTYKPDFDPMTKKLGAKYLSFLKRFIDEYLFQGDIKIWLDIVKRFSNTISRRLNREDIDFANLNMKEKLLSGEVCIYPKGLDSIQSFLYSKELIHSFLKAVQENGFSLNEHKDRILKRYAVSNVPIDYNDVLFDPLGGPYIIGPLNRRKIFQIRSAFHMSLSDMALKTKGQILLQNGNK